MSIDKHRCSPTNMCQDRGMHHSSPTALSPAYPPPDLKEREAPTSASEHNTDDSAVLSHSEDIMNGVPTKDSFASLPPEWPPPRAPLCRVLLVDKLTRYEAYLREHHAQCEKARVKFPNMYKTYVIHRRSSELIQKLLHQNGVEVTVYKSLSRSIEMSQLAEFDAVISAGGDGTFLDAASLISPISGTGHLPLFGLNTDPERSEGRLLMNKEGESIESAVQRILEGDYTRLNRQRIHITIKSDGSPLGSTSPRSVTMATSPSHAHATHHPSPQTTPPSTCYPAAAVEKRASSEDGQMMMWMMLSHRPLNDVMVAALEAMPTVYCEVKVDDREPERQKHSGIIICTGTGSTAWAYNVSKVRPSVVEHVLEAFADSQSSNPEAQSAIRQALSNGGRDMVDEVTEAVNSTLVFDPEVPLLRWTIREPIENRVFQVSKSSGHAHRVSVRPLSAPLYLFLDGLTTIPLNIDQTAYFTVDPQDALHTAL